MHLYKADNKILNGWKWPKKRLYEQLFWVIFSYRNVQYNKLVLEFHTAFFRHFLNLFSTRASSSSTFPLIHRTAFWWPWNMYRTGISRPCPAPRLTLVPKTSALHTDIDEVVERASDSEEDGPDDAMEVEGEPAVTSKEALEMLDKLLVFFESNDAVTEDLRCLSLLTKKVEQLRLHSKKQKTINDFFGSAWLDPSTSIA